MFGDAYGGHDRHRPKYGNVNFLARMKGDRSATAYGQSFLLLRQAIRARCTVSSRDSCHADAQLGTLEHCAHVLLHMIKRCPREGGERCRFIQVLTKLGDPTGDGALEAIETMISGVRTERLDYMELQIHGLLEFKSDVSMVVVADGDVAKGRALGAGVQAGLWRRFTQNFGVHVLHMAAEGMVPLC